MRKPTYTAIKDEKIFIIAFYRQSSNKTAGSKNMLLQMTTNNGNIVNKHTFITEYLKH